MDEVFKDSNGFVYAYIYINDRVYEVWKRERVIGSVPGWDWWDGMGLVGRS